MTKSAIVNERHKVDEKYQNRWIDYGGKYIVQIEMDGNLQTGKHPQSHPLSRHRAS